jgi:hypothetical protein
LLFSNHYSFSEKGLTWSVLETSGYLLLYKTRPRIEHDKTCFRLKGHHCGDRVVTGKKKKKAAMVLNIPQQNVTPF